MHGMDKRDVNVFATPEQEMLLKASLLKGDPSLIAWREWRASINIEDHMDNGSFRLLPLLYQNLRKHHVEDPLMDRLKGIYRQTWYKNQKLFYETGKILKYFHDAGIQTMIVKGAALSALTYKNHGVRPMSDVDVMVPFSQILTATEVLRQKGWAPCIYPESEETLKYRISLQYKNSCNDEFDLHWFPYIEFNRKKLDGDLWNHSVPIMLANEETTAPCPTDNLIHVMIHGTWWNPEPPIRWIADAMSIFNAFGVELDWERFVNTVRINRIALRIRDALVYLKNTFHADIPNHVIKTIIDMPTSITERIAYSYSLRNPNIITEKFGYIPILYLDFLRINSDAGLLQSTINFPRYLQYNYQMDHLSDVFFYLTTALVRKARKILLSGRLGSVF